MTKAKELKNWMYDTKVADVDAVLEYLHDQKMLNKRGEKLAMDFWENYIKTSKPKVPKVNSS